MRPEDMKGSDYIENEEVGIDMKNKMFANTSNNHQVPSEDYNHHELAFQNLHELNLENNRPIQKAKCKTS